METRTFYKVHRDAMDDDIGHPLILATRRTVARLLSSRNGGALNPDSADSALHAFTAVTSRTLATVLRAHNMHSRLASLPQGVLERVCQYLSFVSRVRLSHVCHYLRDIMLRVPGIWKNIDYRTNKEPIRPLDTQAFDRLQPMIERSGLLHPLMLTIDLSPEVLSSRWTQLVRILPRITSLALNFYVDGLIDYTTIGGPAFWNSALEALSAPAPLLDYLKLSVAEHSRHQNEWDEYPVRTVAYNPLPLGSTLFAGDTSRLRTCSLQGVRLPSTTFRNVSCFHFCTNSALRVEEIARMLSFLPALVSLSLSAPYIDGPAHRGTQAQYQTPPGTVHPRIRNLSLSADMLEAETLCSLIDFRALRYLEICPGFDAGLVVAAAYPNSKEDFTYLSLALCGTEILVNDRTTIRSYYVFQGFPALMSACSRTARVFVHEFEWPTDFWGLNLAALPCATYLCVRLASCADRFFRFNCQHATGIFQASGRWEFAALKELHITAPFTCGHADCSGRCSAHGVSISLRDVADFVRGRIRFDAPKLTSIRLSGFRIVDLDYIAAHDELLALTENLLLDEDAQDLPCMDLAEIESLPRFCDRFQDYD